MAYDPDYHRTHGGEILPLVVDGENYYTAKEAAEYLSIARDTFYRNVRNRLPIIMGLSGESIFASLISIGTAVFALLKKTNKIRARVTHLSPTTISSCWFLLARGFYRLKNLQ
jgi:hypothetical protein